MRLCRSILSAALAAATAINAIHNVTVYNNDTSIQYTGFSWSPYTNCGGTKYTYTQGQLFSFSFVGTAIYVVGTSSQQGGEIVFNLDGKQQSTFDRYAPPPYLCGVSMFSKDNLAYGQHSLQAVFNGNSPENTTAGAAFLEWMWLEYTALDPADVAALSSSSLASLTGTATSSATYTTTTGSGNGGAAKKSNGAAIGGGIAAGVVAILVIAGIAWYCLRKNNNNSGGVASNRYNARPDISGDNPGFSPTNAVSQPLMSQSSHGAPPTVPYQNQDRVPGSSAWTPDPFTSASLSPSSSYPPTQVHQPMSPGGFSVPGSFGPGSVGPGSVVGPASVSSGSVGPGPSGPQGFGIAAATLATPALEHHSSSYASSSNEKSGMSASQQPLLYTSNPTQGPSGNEQQQQWYPPHMNPSNNQFQPTQGPASVHTAGGATALPESDVDRIAARIATMMGGGGNSRPLPQTGGTGNEDYDAPPPMYNEKR